MLKQYPIESIPLDLIDDSGHGLERFRSNLGDLEELEAAILDDGLISPPVLWRPKTGAARGRYVVIDGNRRIAAIKELARDWDPSKGEFPLSKVQCVIYACGLASDARLLSIGLHLGSAQGMETNAGDAAIGIKFVHGFNSDWTQTEAGKWVGRSQPWVSIYEAIADGLCPTAMACLRAGQISKTDAKMLAGWLKRGEPDAERQEAWLEKNVTVEPTGGDSPR